MKKDKTEVRKGSCPGCVYACHVKVQVKDGEMIGITPDPDSPKGKYLCGKSIVAVDFHYHPGRLNFPLKRVGERGEGKWEKVTWDQAVDEIAQKLDELRSKFGPETVAAMGGGNVTSGDAAAWKWCNLWGTPNIFWQGKNCGESEFLAECAIYGYITASQRAAPNPDITKCAIIWGYNPRVSREHNWASYMQGKRRGMKIVVVDPRLTGSAEAADIWIQLRPGTDGALALGMLNIIINEELYDKEFVKRWTVGFDELETLVQKYPPDKVEIITWVPKKQIMEVARLYATQKPAFLSGGVAVCHLGRGAGFSAVVGKCLLRSVTGNIDKNGGNPFITNPEVINYLEELCWDGLLKHPLRTRDNVSAHVWPIASVQALKRFRENSKKVYPRGVGISHYHLYPGSHYLWSAILDKDPYPLKAIILANSNPLVVLSNAKRIYKALKSSNLELLVAMDRWMTPSAQLADYVLPSTDNLERPDLDNMWGMGNIFHARENAFDPLYERKDDYYLWRDLGMRLGQESRWEETLERWFDKMLEPTKLSFKELAAKDVPVVTGSKEYMAYEKKGFATSSGKVELASTLFKEMGYDSLPDYQEPPWSPISTPDLAKEYPLILISGGRVPSFRHSQHRQLQELRRRYPYPLLQIHPETAQRLLIADGDPVYIETPIGSVRQRAKLTKRIDPRVVHADAYWWYPELPLDEPCLSGVWDSNINAILPDEPNLCDYSGDNPFRSLLCKVFRSKEL